MNWLDIVILVIIVGTAFMGLKVGLIKGVLSLIGLIGSIILAGRYYSPLSERLTFIPQIQVAEAIAFIIILAGVMIITGVVAALLGRVASALALGWLNHLGGVVFGLMMGATVCAALLAIWVKFFGLSDTIRQSGIATLLLGRFPAILALLPKEFGAIRSFFQ